MDEGLRFYALVQQLKRDPTLCVVSLSWEMVVCVTSGVQLAMQHPEVPAGAREEMRAFALALIDQVGGRMPELADIMLRGFEVLPPA